MLLNFLRRYFPSLLCISHLKSPHPPFGPWRGISGTFTSYKLHFGSPVRGEFARSHGQLSMKLLLQFKDILTYSLQSWKKQSVTGHCPATFWKYPTNFALWWDTMTEQHTSTSWVIFFKVLSVNKLRLVYNVHCGAFASYLLAAQRSICLFHGCQQCRLTCYVRQ